MQERFKFRAWHKEKQEMHNIEGLNAYDSEYTEGGEVFFQEDSSPKNSYYFPEEVELIQCTGLKDKNGKLIYEGDILAIHTHFDSLVPDSNEYRYADEKGISYFKVAYDNDKARFYLIRTKWIKWNTRHTMLDYIPANHSIVGNIYDNPELLEGIQNNER